MIRTGTSEQLGLSAGSSIPQQLLNVRVRPRTYHLDLAANRFDCRREVTLSTKQNLLETVRAVSTTPHTALYNITLRLP